MDQNEEKSALDELEDKLYDPKGKIDNVALHHVRDRKEKELPSSWSEDTPIIHPSEERTGLSFGAKFLIGALGLLVLVLLFTAWRVLSSRNVVSDRNIDMVLDITPYLEGGEATPLVVSLTNRNEVPLEEASLTLLYKQGTGAQDEQEKIQVKRDLGTVAAGDFKRQDFDVTLYGSEGEARDITVKLEYKVPGSNAKFSKVAVSQVVLKSPPISVHIDGPDTLSVGQTGTFTLSVKNNTGTTTAASLLMATLPTNFTLESADPRPSARGTVWQIKELAPGESQSVTITGSLAGNQGEVSTVRALVGSVGEGSTQIGVVYSSELLDIKLRSSPLSVSFTLDTERGASESLRYGDRILLSIKYKNTGTDTLQNPEVTLKISGDAAVLKDVHSDYGLYDSTSGTITWNRASLDNFESLAGGQEGIILVTIPIVTKGSNSPKLTLSVTGKASSKEVNDVVTSISKSYVVQGSASIVARTQYKNSPFQNVGPIPPQVNVDTTYTIHLIASAQNALSNAKVSFILPAYVTWRNIASDAANTTYDAKTRTVTWTIGSIQEGKTVMTDIGVSVRPTQVHANSIPTITGGIVFDADETVSKAHIRVSTSALTTAISGEAWNVDPSIVVGQ